MRLIQDNARPHVSSTTLEYLQGNNVRLIKQPAYSPDCNLCHRYIFNFNRLEAKRGDFSNTNDVIAFLNQQLPLFTAERMNAWLLQKMEEDLQKMIENGGGYL